MYKFYFIYTPTKLYLQELYWIWKPWEDSQLLYAVYGFFSAMRDMNSNSLKNTLYIIKFSWTRLQIVQWGQTR